MSKKPLNLDFLKQINEFIYKNAPSYDVIEDDTKTAKLLKQRRRLGITHLLNPDSKFHMENEKYVFKNRLKLQPFRHFRLFGARGEFLIVGLAFFSLAGIVNNARRREDVLHSTVVDSNVYLKANLPAQYRLA